VLNGPSRRRRFPCPNERCSPSFSRINRLSLPIVRRIPSEFSGVVDLLATSSLCHSSEVVSPFTPLTGFSSCLHLSVFSIGSAVLLHWRMQSFHCSPSDKETCTALGSSLFSFILVLSCVGALQRSIPIRLSTQDYACD